MRKQPASIFNEVFGPVMTGPSSSHTAGPARIGMMVHRLVSEPVSRIEITFDRRGSFAAQYRAQGSDFGFVGGLLGIDIADEQIKRSLIMAKERGIEVDFRIEELDPRLHPNFARISVETDPGENLVVEAESTGGGMFALTRYDGIPLTLRGDYYELLVLTSALPPDPEDTDFGTVRALLDDAEVRYHLSSHHADSGMRGLINVKFDRPVPEELREKIGAVADATRVVYVEPILPVVKQIGTSVPFFNATEATEYARKNHRSLWELAVDYETTLSGKSRDEVIAMMAEIAEIMRDSAAKGIAGNYPQRGFLPPKSGEMDRNFRTGTKPSVDTGVLNKAAIWATAVMEYDICMGRVVAAPTGGSSGVLPGAVVAVGEEMGKTNEEIARALLVGGLIGVFVDHQATFAAEIAACQAENGAAGSMAAAAVVQLLGGTVEEGFAAASLALQNMLGLICDPVAGTGNVPCVGRNAAAATNAVISANMVSWGFNPAIPLDEVIETMLKVGQMMPSELRCTGTGGLCTTCTAQMITKNLDLTPVLE